MEVSVQAQQLNQNALATFGALFASLPPPGIAELNGVYQAEFVGPLWLRKLVKPALVLTGLGGWWGKVFDGRGNADNIVQRQGELRRILPMKLVASPSRIDGRPGITVTYMPDARLPWPWIIDELRRLDEGCLLGMTMLPKGPLAHLALPFLLHYSVDRHGL